MPSKEVQKQIKNKKLVKYLEEKQKDIKQQTWKSMIPNAPK